MTLLPLYLFPNVNWWRILVQNKDCKIETCENWIKQSGRTRYEISGANKRLLLAVPTIKSSRKRMVDVQIDSRENWAINHWRSLESSYNKSPFFDFYKDELKDILFADYKTLFELNKQSIAWCKRQLDLDIEPMYTDEYLKEAALDYRTALPELEPLVYPQVFEGQIGFLEDLSIMDMLFNQGPEAGAMLYA